MKSPILEGGVFLVLCALIISVFGEEECVPYALKSTDVGFYQFSLDLLSGEEVSVDSLDASSIKTAKTYIVIDGFLSNLTTPMSRTVKDELIKIPESNVIVVDWGPLSGSTSYTGSMNPLEVGVLYDQVTQNVPLVGQKIADFVQALKDKKNIQFSQVHVVGFSLGAQIGAVAGLELLKRSGEKLARISALDPAGPKYKNGGPENRLDDTDAAFVDVYHTNRLGFGNDRKNIGHANFYINGGNQQPECESITAYVEKGICNHQFSWKFWNLAVVNDIKVCPCELKLFSKIACDCKDCERPPCENPIRTGLNLLITYAKYIFEIVSSVVDQVC
ncbi:unnamed protein product [Orchesella dallaii]|uniref:Lipase domain-containing protein n=1 Tax=Orchesella dallaii TaxID=48710 RepID=A0ABP1RVT9_9HEXA